VKLALAIAAGTEDGTHSAVRHAKEAGISMEEMEYVVMLSVTTLRFPAARRALAWNHGANE
jgi:alkylhydroperoxidase/carboxymuconolactone decarboxylase family protein YurZ